MREAQADGGGIAMVIRTTVDLHSMRRAAFAAAILAVCALHPAPSHAALFDDDEARRQIVELRGRVADQQKAINDRLDQLSQSLQRIDAAVQDKKALLDIAAQVDAIRGDLAKLRGDNEVLVNRADNLERRQKDLYVDLDTRLRKMEQAQAALADKLAAPEREAAQEKDAYDAALSQFKQNNFGASIAAFQSFLSNYASSTLAPSAQYWIGNAYYALRDYQNTITAQQKLLSTWPDNAKAPDAMLNIASAQAEMGNAKAARDTLLLVQKKFPGSPAAEQAKQRLNVKR